MAPQATDKQLERLRAAVEGLAAQDAAQLIADARRDARERARKLLADVMTEAMLESAQTYVQQEKRRESRPRAAPAGQTRATEEAPPRRTKPREKTKPPTLTTPECGLYIYCVVPAGTELPEELIGIDAGRSPTTIEHEKVAAVVSQVSLDEFEEERLREHFADLGWVERTARTHEQALETIGRNATLIPMRMCSVYRDESGVREMLEREATALENGLAHLEGKAEWGVKVFAAEPRPDAQASAEPMAQTDSEVPTGTDYMRSRQSERDARRVESEQLDEAAAAVHERLAEIAADALSAPLQRPELTGHDGAMLHNGVYLVEDRDIERFLSAVHSLQDEYEGLELAPTGPWPAYNFVPAAIGAAW